MTNLQILIRSKRESDDGKHFQYNSSFFKIGSALRANDRCCVLRLSRCGAKVIVPTLVQYNQNVTSQAIFGDFAALSNFY